MFHRHPNGVWCCLPKATNTCVAHGLTKLLQQWPVPGIRLHQLYRFLATYAAGRALATAFVLKEPKHVKRGIPRLVVI